MITSGNFVEVNKRSKNIKETFEGSSLKVIMDGFDNVDS